MIALVGYTGFVGSNIYVRASNRIEGVYDTQNVEKAYGLEPDVLVFAALRSDKDLAHRAPYDDYERVLEAQRTIKKINPAKLVLISTTDVYKNPVGVDEENSVFAVGSEKADKEGIMPYNLNRYYFEAWARKNYSDLLIMRLARPYGLNAKDSFLKDFTDESFMKQVDSNSKYQFYPLSRIWEDIQTAIAENLPIVNMTSEPISAGEIYECLAGKDFKPTSGKEASKKVLTTEDVMTIYADKFGGSGKYICPKSEILGSIKQFVD